MDALEFVAIAVGFGALVLVLTAHLTGRALLVGLLLGTSPALLLWLLAPGGSSGQTVAIPMASGAPFAAVIRRAMGWETPLRRSPVD